MARQRLTHIPTPHVLTRCAPGLVMGPCIVEIDRIVIREVKYQYEWAWPMWAGRPRVGNGAMHKVQYQFEVNRCRNKEYIVMGPCIVEINRIVIREVQYQFEVNRCRNEKVIVKGNFWWAWPMWAGRLRIDHIVKREVQHKFEVNRCSFGWAWPMWAGGPMIDRIFIREVQYQFEDNRWVRSKLQIFQGSSANSVGGHSGQDGRTAEITTISPRFSKSVWIKTILGGCGLLWAGRLRIDRIVIRDAQYQFEVNQCRNEEIIVKCNFGWAWPMWPGRSRVGNGAMHMNRCRNEEIIVKGNFGWAWPMWAGRPRINCIVIREVQYKFEVNRCRNEENKVKGNFGWAWPMRAWPMWAWPMWAGRPRIDRIVIREVQYHFEVNRCRNEEIIVKGNFGWAWPMWAWPMWAECPRIDRIVIREVQYQFEVNRCRNEEIRVKGNFGWAWPMWPRRPRIDRIVIREAQYQFEVNRCRIEEVNFQGSSANNRTYGQTHITTISPLFLRKTWG
ncbi:hypothetical protein DPMN_065540 [Dreissena polymorpha]|uniref:Uncharacterized protein n=1 Tax=Dreissena polymorpha TaxID=45954 RepID=A0A9D4BRD4_DREPO|nr:hypothetical protein DPMN_065540 [Dreissena polymorpha]